MKRVVEFIRSLIPEDPWQLLYLAGAVFLFLSPRMRWSFQTGIPFGFIALAMVPVVFAGMFAYYRCFRSGAHPLRRISLAVFLPALLGISLLIGEFTFFNETNQSLFARRPGLADFLHQSAVVFKGHPTGFTFAWIALAMIAVFAIRMHLGISSLPLQPRRPIHRDDESTTLWYNTQMLIFVLVCPLFLLHQFTGILFSIPGLYWNRAGSWGFTIDGALTEIFNASLLVLLAVLILGQSGIKSARASLRLPEPRFAFFGLILPIFVSFMISSVGYGLDRVRWAARDFGKALPPQFGDYFSFGEAWRWTLVLMVFAAFAEEIVFRGMLLRPLLERFGLHRGIFLTGLIWAAFHFHGDMHYRYSMRQVLLELALRVAICLAMNYALSWMTLQWNSIIPAGIAHTVSNVLIVGRINGDIPFTYELEIVLWAVCALALFHFRPIREMPEAGSKEHSEAPIQSETGHIE